MRLSRLLRFAPLLASHRFTGVDLILTRRCNMACPYCGVIRGAGGEQLAPEQWKRVIEYFRRHRHVHFIFTGGEALLYPGLAELVAYTAPKALTCLMSNGKALDADVLAGLPGLDFLVLSLDPEVGDPSDSGKHGFGRLEELRAHADRSGLSISVGITVTRRNVEAIPDLARRLRDLRFPLLLSLYHAGDDGHDFRTDLADLDFRTDQDLAALDAMANELIELKRSGFLIGESEAFLRALVPFKRGQVVTECRAGLDWFEVDCDGRIKACHDGPPTRLNALDQPDYQAMRREVARSAPPGCRCVYDFYFNAQHLRTRPLSYLWDVLRSRRLLQG